MEYKTTTFLPEHYVCTAVTYKLQRSLQFWNTSIDKLAFDRRERVGRIIRPALLKTPSLTATTDLINFITVICKIWRKIGLGLDTSMAETRQWYVSRPSRDRDVDTQTTTLRRGQLQLQFDCYLTLYRRRNWVLCSFQWTFAICCRPSVCLSSDCL